MGTLCVSSCIGKVRFEYLYGDASVGANTLASMMQALERLCLNACMAMSVLVQIHLPV